MKTYNQFILESVELKDVIKLLDLPNVRQGEKWSCGAIALQTVLVYYGIDEREGDLIDELKTDEDGTNPDNIVKYCHKIGLKTDVMDNMEVEDLISYIDDEIPVIIEIQAWKDDKKIKYEDDWKSGHFTVVVGYTKKEIILSDPSSFTLTYITFKDLMKRWHDVDGKEKHIQSGIAIYGKKPVFDKDKIEQEE